MLSYPSSERPIIYYPNFDFPPRTEEFQLKARRQKSEHHWRNTAVLAVGRFVALVRHSARVRNTQRGINLESIKGRTGNVYLNH